MGFGLFLIKVFVCTLDMILKGITEIKFARFEENLKVVLIIKKVLQKKNVGYFLSFYFCLKKYQGNNVFMIALKRILS